jgi:hypothetical protein
MTRQVVCLHHFAFPDRDQPPEQAKPCGSSPNLPTNCGSRAGRSASSARSRPCRYGAPNWSRTTATPQTALSFVAVSGRGGWPDEISRLVWCPRGDLQLNHTPRTRRTTVTLETPQAATFVRPEQCASSAPLTEGRQLLTSQTARPPLQESIGCRVPDARLQTLREGSRTCPGPLHRSSPRR